MIKAFRLEEAVLQLTASRVLNAYGGDKPMWIALSRGSQCIAGLRMNTITKHIDLSALLEFHDLESLEGYELQRPWITDVLDEE